MADSQFMHKSKKKKSKKDDETTDTPAVSSGPADRAQKLKDLDEFIDGVLSKAGQEFLDEFKQVEGE
jgi:hypothetical protein